MRTKTHILLSLSIWAAMALAMTAPFALADGPAMQKQKQAPGSARKGSSSIRMESSKGIRPPGGEGERSGSGRIGPGSANKSTPNGGSFNRNAGGPVQPIGPPQEVKLELIPSGASARFYYHFTQRLKLDDERPAGIKKLPADLSVDSAPLFGKLQRGPRESPTTFHVVIYTPQGKPDRLLVDTNSNGDLADDPPTVWERRRTTLHLADGDQDVSYYYGGAMLDVPCDKGTLPLHMLLAYHLDKNDPQRDEDHLIWCQDYAPSGKVRLGTKAYQALMVDSFGIGDYRGRLGAGPPIRLGLDLNRDGRFDPRGELFPVYQPFNVGGVTYEIMGMTPSGTSFQIVKSAKTAAATWPPPIPRGLMEGAAEPFQATTTDEKLVKFPQHYKGKLVLLYFWSTASEPSVAELSNLAAAYKKFQSRGFEVLGVSLDQASLGDTLARFTHDNKLSWPQICDGQAWEGELATKYFVQSLPRAILVDGTSGLFLANDNDLRGSNLAQTLEDALARKGQK
ncbi:MAG: TlpA disulfide reductase family protein [Pirellulales bacterium]